MSMNLNAKSQMNFVSASPQPQDDLMSNRTPMTRRMRGSLRAELLHAVSEGRSQEMTSLLQLRRSGTGKDFEPSSDTEMRIVPQDERSSEEQEVNKLKDKLNAKKHIKNLLNKATDHVEDSDPSTSPEELEKQRIRDLIRNPISGAKDGGPRRAKSQGISFKELEDLVFAPLKETGGEKTDGRIAKVAERIANTINRKQQELMLKSREGKAQEANEGAIDEAIKKLESKKSELEKKKKKEKKEEEELREIEEALATLQVIQKFQETEQKLKQAKTELQAKKKEKKEKKKEKKEKTELEAIQASIKTLDATIKKTETSKKEQAKQLMKEVKKLSEKVKTTATAKVGKMGPEEKAKLLVDTLQSIQKDFGLSTEECAKMFEPYFPSAKTSEEFAKALANTNLKEQKKKIDELLKIAAQTKIKCHSAPKGTSFLQGWRGSNDERVSKANMKTVCTSDFGTVFLQRDPIVFGGFLGGVGGAVGGWYLAGLSSLGGVWMVLLKIILAIVLCAPGCCIGLGIGILFAMAEASSSSRS